MSLESELGEDLKHLEQLGTKFNITIPKDEDGLIGRECPLPECESYFKLQPGTGLKGEGLPCHCPYCGHKDSPDKFFTKAQIEYAKSIVLNQVTGTVLKDLKELEFNHRPSGSFGIGISMKVTSQPSAIRHYREQQLETDLICESCALHYTIYGVFGFCPDCGVHNSIQILKKNFELVEKMLDLAEKQEASVAQTLTENALEDCISAFDGFGRESCRLKAPTAVSPSKAAEIRFQNIGAARQKVQEQFVVDIASGLNEAEWTSVRRSFQKRHLLAHKMGVVDEEYLAATNDTSAAIGRKITVQADEVRALSSSLEKLGLQLFEIGIRASILVQPTKPSLEKPPSYFHAEFAAISGLENIDNLVLKASCEHLVEEPHIIFEPHLMFGETSELNLPKQEVLDSLEVLEGAGYVQRSHYGGGDAERWGCHYSVTTFGFHEYCQAYVPEFDTLLHRASAMIANEEVTTNYDLRDKLSMPIGIANHVIAYLEDRGLLRTSDECSERICIYQVAAELRRAHR